MGKHTPKEFWILDTPSNPYPICYRGEPRWDGEPDTTGVVIRVQEITPLTEAAPALLEAVKIFYEFAGRVCPSQVDKLSALISKAEGREP